MEIYVARIFITDTENYTPPLPWHHELSIVVDLTGDLVKFVAPSEVLDSRRGQIPSNKKLEEYSSRLELSSGKDILLLAMDMYSRVPLFNDTEIIEDSTFKDIVDRELKETTIAYARRTANIDLLKELGAL